MEKQKNEVKIYVACLASYNNGILYGKWIDPCQSVPAMRAEIASMLTSSPVSDAEEYAIHDFDGFEGLCIAEYQSLESVAEIAKWAPTRATVRSRYQGISSPPMSYRETESAPN